MMNVDQRVLGILCLVAVAAFALGSGCTGSQDIGNVATGQTTLASLSTIPQETQAADISSTTPQTVLSPAFTISPAAIPRTPLPALNKTIKDSDLLFSLQVPDNFYGMTRRIPVPEHYRGIVYETSVLERRLQSPEGGPVDGLVITTYGITRNQDQDVLNRVRDWWEKPVETTAVINGITFTRVESGTAGKTSVMYIGSIHSANERGYAVVIEYTVDQATSLLGVDGHDAIVKSFRWVPLNRISSAPGIETEKDPRV